MLKNKKDLSRWPYFSRDEVAAAIKVLESSRINYWTGDECRLFEKEYAAYLGVNHAVALANGTVALEAALSALGVGRGDDVVVSSRTFIASASCVALQGARPIMADVDRNSQNITAETIVEVLTPKTKAIIAVHLAGWPCDMDPIMHLAKKKGLYVIEDCAQAHGATYKGRPVGSIGDVAAFSFCQDKIITTAGEGGLLATNDKKVWEKVWSFKDHGKSYDAVYNRKHTGGFRWLHESFGTNWRMTEIQAAIGRIQLKKLPEWVDLRSRNSTMLNECFAIIPALRVTIPPKEIGHAYYKYYAFVRPEALKKGWDRDRIIDTIADNGVFCQGGSCSEIYLEKAFDKPGLRPSKRLKVAKELGETSLMFHVHPTLTEHDINKTCKVVRRVLNDASR